MSYGIFINGIRPVSKKAIKEALLNDPASVYVESTHMFSEMGFSERVAPGMTEITFAGPDPYTSRKFYGQIGYKAGKYYCK